MSTYKLRRFANPETLKRVDASNLFRLFDSFRSYFEGHGYELTDPIRDFDGLIRLIATPSAGMPEELAEALLMVEEITGSDQIDSIREDHQDLFPPYREMSQADLALELWLKRPDALKRLHAEVFLKSRQSFVHFRAVDCHRLNPAALEEAGVASLQETLDTWFLDHNRGRGTQVLRFQDGSEVSFLIRHGGPFKREGVMEDGEPKSILYRPELYDITTYGTDTGDLRVKARSKREMRLYVAELSKLLFGRPEQFRFTTLFSLEPIRDDGRRCLECSDIPGIESITLREIHLGWGGAYQLVEVKKASNLFEALKGEDIPPEPRIEQAKFEFRFKTGKGGIRKRAVTVAIPNSARYMRDSDGSLVHLWLRKRGFLAPSDEWNA